MVCGLEAVDLFGDLDDGFDALLEGWGEVWRRVGSLLEDEAGKECDDFFGFVVGQHVLQDKLRQDKLVGRVDFAGNLALELVRATEAAAIACSRYLGFGDKEQVDQAAVDAMRPVLGTVRMNGVVVIGEGEKDEAPMLANGEQVGDQFLAPGWTDYRKRIQHQTYDVTALLREGANAIGVHLADGWFTGFVGFTGKRGWYGDRTGAFVQLEVEHPDGGRTVVTTDGTWRSAPAVVTADATC